jgi:hypothetical protein
MTRMIQKDNDVCHSTNSTSGVDSKTKTKRERENQKGIEKKNKPKKMIHVIN